MSRRDEPAPAGEDRGRARTGRRRRRSWRGRKPPPASNGSAGEDSVAAELVNPPAEVTKPAGSGGKRRKSAVPARLRRVEEVSAGGLVVDDRDGLVVGALIAKHDRRGRLVWSLPKGHVENGETFEQTAAREVAEETGVTGEV
ncbi:MAG: NUDIX domain-containing protein, partial [Micromonosporaceae bacterium]